MTDSSTYRTNRDLFSNHYLDDHLRETEPWKEASDADVEAAYEDIKELWAEKQGRVNDYNEAQLEKNFIRPIFDILGIPFEIEETVMRNARRPDYGFFPSEEAADAAFDREDFFQEATAVADAKRWGRKLDTRGKEKYDFENPSYQIHRYLQETPTQWGVLTNGEKWRLYYGPTSHRLDSYYEINLPELLDIVDRESDFEAFKEFYLFFRQEAFLPDQTGDCFLDDVYDESSIFAEELGEDLQENIYEAIRVLAEGFLDTNDDLDEDDLDLIHDSSLIYLYRLIFVLYAESEGRDLLPTDNVIYSGSYSLNELKLEVVENRDATKQHYQTWQTELWDQLDELFVLIDQGSQGMGIPKDDLYIPAYNGGLFRTNPDEDDSVESQFLSNYEAGDAYIAEVIELLTRHEADEGKGKVFVDYSSLDERNLGSIYEGLLEYKLDVADEPLTVEDGEYTPAGEDDEVTVETGEVYLQTDDGERKATGSYYTPEYVVEYIVDETLGPLVDEIQQDLVSQSADTTHSREGGFAEEFADRIFDLTVLDPAMGSGHFPVNAVDYLARKIIDAQEKQDRQAMDAEDAEVRAPTTKEGELRDINWARRKVAQRCIYGVDVNPLATELAKVSLWLRTLAAEQPLAFLDHHLKTGNSLVGSDIEDVLSDGDDDSAGDGQLTLQESFDHTRQRAMEHVTDRFQDLLNIDNETLEDAKEMEAVYDDVRADPLYKKLLAMANVHTADAFGLDVPSDADERMARALHSEAWENIEEQDWFKSAQTMAGDERFFHWELEFPMAFYDQDGERKADAGFDAVIGNPPYVRQEQITQAKPFLERNYETYSSAADLYVYFIEKGVDILRQGGLFGYITSNKFMRANYGEGIRSYLTDNSNIEEIVDFGELPVFEDASTFPAILLLKNNFTSENRPKITKVKSLQFDDISQVVSENHYFTSERGLSDGGWSLARKAKLDIQTKMEESGINLIDYLPSEINWGIKTGLNEAFVVKEDLKQELINNDPNSAELIKPLIVGDNVRKYQLEYNDQYLIRIPSGWTQKQCGTSNEKEAWNWFSSEYTAIAEHLSNFEKKARDRYDQGEFWWELRPCDYYDIFESPKLIYPEISMEPRFTIDFEGYYPNNKCFVTPTNDLYLLTLLNSTLLFEIAKLYVSILGDEEAGGRLELRTVHVEQLPIIDPEYSPDPETCKERATDLFDHYISWIDNDSIDLPTITAPTINSGVQRALLTLLGQEMLDLHTSRDQYNLNLLDYLDNYDEGPTLPDTGFFQPPRSNILGSTTDEYEKLQIERARTRRDGSTVTIEATARYKPENKDEFETDAYDYTETEFFEAFTLTDLSDTEAALVEAFVPVAVDEEIGGFRDNATKTNSLIDRLKGMTLPDPDDVADDLRRYIETKERADELDEKIEKTDRLIDEIVYDLYDLTDEEIEIVEEAVES